MSADQKNLREPSTYKSKFENWDHKASVRAKPRRSMSDEEADGKFFFTPELVPVSNHPIIQERGDDAIRKVVIHHLYTHLDFTENLEHQVVNQVAFQIGRKRFGFELHKKMIEDAWKLYVDEAYHAMFSADLAAQVEEATGVTPLMLGTPRFLLLLHEIEESVPANMRDLVRTFFTIVSETLISGTLGQVPKDRRVVSTVREVIGDHAEDEGCHHAYFASLLKVLWPQLNTRQRAIIGPILPKFVLGFLEPDFVAVREWLRAMDLTAREIETILRESYPRDKVLKGIREGAMSTLRYFERNGVYEDPRTAEEFEKSGLILNGKPYPSQKKRLEPAADRPARTVSKPEDTFHRDTT